MTNKNKVKMSWIINLVIMVLNSLATILNPSTKEVAIGLFSRFIG